MNGIDKGFLFGILTEVLRGNKRQTFSLPKYLANFPNFTGIPAHSLVK